MSKLVLIGGGGHCKSVLDAALRMDIFQQIVILDPSLPIGSELMGCVVLGNDDKLKVLRKEGFENAFITVGCIGDTALRRKLAKKSGDLDFNFPIIIDPSAVVSEFAKLDVGAFIGKNAVVNAGARIGKHTIINTGAIIEHDCRIGAFTHVAVGATICGDCDLGEDVFVGAGATIIQGISINNKRFINAGKVVVE